MVEKMTSKQRFLTAISRGVPDRLPVTTHHVYLLNNLGSGGGKVRGSSLLGTLADKVGQCGDGTSA